MAYNLDGIRKHGIILRGNGNRLEVYAPPGVMNETRSNILRRDREAILRQLEEEKTQVLASSTPKKNGPITVPVSRLPTFSAGKNPDPSPIPEPDHPLSDGADRDSGSAGARAQIPGPGPNSTRSEHFPSYLEALSARIQALEAEYAAAYGEPAPGELETCRELPTKTLLPPGHRPIWARYKALSLIERLRTELETARSAGRTSWTGRSSWRPAPAEEQQKPDGSFVPAELEELDQAVPAPTKITVIMGTWNQMTYGKKAVKCTRTAPGVVKCELVGEADQHEKVIPRGKIPVKTAIEYQKGA